MNISKSLLTTAALVASFGASASAGAQVTGSLGGPLGPFLALSGPAACTVGSPCTLGAGVGTIVGGSIFDSDRPFADIPAGAVFGSRFLSSGPTSTSPSALTFSGPGLASIGFLWGSPDTYNRLTVNYMFLDGSSDNTGTVFTAAGLGFSSTSGDQNVSQYVRFNADAGVLITSLEFSNSPSRDAFEVANFSTNVVPEPATYALMAAGLAALGLVSRRRKQA